MLTAEQVAAAASALYRAELDNELITPISEQYPDADVEDAYRIALAVTELKVAGRPASSRATRSGSPPRPCAR